MSRGPSRKKLEEWTSRLGRFEQSNQTVAVFCQHEGVSAASLYQWKRKLREPLPAATPAFVPVRVASPIVTRPQDETVIQLGNGVRIQLGRDLPVVELILKQLLAATLDPPSAGAKPC